MGILTVTLILSFALRAQHRDPSLLRFLSLRPTPAPSPRAALPLLSFRDLRTHDASLAEPGEMCRIAVLGFRGAKARREDEWLAVELADSLARKLGTLGGLEFIDTAAVRSFERRHAKGRAAELDRGEAAALARRAEADIVVSGTLARKGGALAVDLRVMRPSTGAVSDRVRVEGRGDRICEIEARMASRIASLLGIALDDAELERLAGCPTSSPAAFEELARACQAPDGSHTKIRHLQRAVEADPGCVEARCMLGDAYYGIGVTYQYVEWFNMALAEYRKAAALSPGCARAYGGMGLVYMMNGRYDLARRALEKAVEADPGSKAARSSLARLDGMGF